MIFLVHFSVFAPGNWIVRISFGLREFVDNARFGVFLRSQMFEFVDSRKFIVVWIIDYRHWLELWPVEGLMFELQTTVRKFPEFELEELIHWTGINHFTVRDDIFDFAVVSVEQNPDVRVIQHVGEHACETMLGHGLVHIGEIPVVAIGAGGNASRYLCIQLRWIQAPLLA